MAVDVVEEGCDEGAFGAGVGHVADEEEFEGVGLLAPSFSEGGSWGERASAAKGGGEGNDEGDDGGGAGGNAGGNETAHGRL